MNAWITDELERISEADELEISSRRPDGTLRRFATIWSVRHDDAIYVRSAYGPENRWFRRARAARAGKIRSGGVERDVTFEAPGPELDDALDRAYHAKYDRFGSQFVDPVVSEEAARSTLRIVPR